VATRLIGPLLAALLLIGAPAAAANPWVEPLEDIHPGPNGASIAWETRVGDAVFFRAEDPLNGAELWRSDGTAAGTSLVKDINPGTADGLPTFLTLDFVNVGGILYFPAEDPVNGLELWRSDGTTTGTYMVENINPGSADSSPHDLTDLGGTLMFAADNGAAAGDELWKSDGTEPGTSLVEDINPGSADGTPIGLVDVDGTLYFSVTEPTVGRELARSDGTPAGTFLVKDVNPGVADSIPRSLTAAGGTLYFVATVPTTGDELWKSDGSGPGTVLVEDIRPGADDSDPEDLTALGSTLVFRADDGTVGSELWKSDGTAAGTALIEDVNPGPSGSATAAIGMTVVGGNAYAAAFTATTGTELWKTDGTEPGTALLKDVNPDAASASPFTLAAAGGKLYFNATSPGIGSELWTTDGTSDGTVLVEDIRPGAGSSSPTRMIELGTGLLFAADDGTSGHELWRLLQPPTASLSAGAMAFGSHAQGTASPPQTATITNNGGAPLNVTGFTFGGANPDDFMLSADTCRGAIAPGAACSVSVRMAPQGSGDRSATLTVLSDAPGAATVALSGTGAAPPADGAAGPPGATGPAGPQGATGKRGKRGRKAKVTCRLRGKRGRKVVCKVRFPRKASSKKARAQWRLTRRGRTVAHGLTAGTTIDMGRARRLRPGRYRLTVTVAGASTVTVIRVG
jgi:ELWxxDGT repeat protein